MSIISSKCSEELVKTVHRIREDNQIYYYYKHGHTKGKCNSTEECNIMHTGTEYYLDKLTL